MSSHCPIFGNLILIPVAIEGKDLAGFCAPGGLVDRALRAANPEK
jgi:hypothetical protein